MATAAEMMAEIARLKAENERLAQAKNRAVTFKVGEKGGVSVYGLNARFPITLYSEQWEKLIAAIPALQAFMATNKAKLSTGKGDTRFAKVADAAQAAAPTIDLSKLTPDAIMELLKNAAK